jgi:hypothetical protein
LESLSDDVTKLRLDCRTKDSAAAQNNNTKAGAHRHTGDAAMISNKRPLSVTILAWVYIAVGTVGLVYHFTEFQARHAFQFDAVWVELTEFLAILCGAFMLRGHNWARWVALAWMAFHVVLSFHAFSQFFIHCLFFAVISWLLFRPPAARYFRGSRIEPT